MKVGLSASLIVWLVWSGTLNLASLHVLVASARMIFLTLALWIVVALALNTLRWTLILRALGTPITTGRALVLQAMAAFFNTAVPGNVGGDVLKNYYQMPGRAWAVAAAASLERFAGLVGLLWMGLLVMAGRPSLFLARGGVSVLAAVLLLLGVGSVLASLAGLYLLGRRAGLPRKATNHPLSRLLERLRRAFPDPARTGRLALWAVLTSVLMHLGNLAYFWFVARELAHTELKLLQLAAVFPLGMLTVVLPISVSGLGVGHAAFEGLFHTIGATGGADVFNVFIVGAIAPNVMGAVPYLWLRRSGSPPAPDAG